MNFPRFVSAACAIFLVLFVRDAVAGAPVPSSHQTKRETIAALDSVIPVLMTKARIPGLSVALIWDGEITWTKGYGCVTS
jgi:CubicO group peptidase (beta-lactamase class C family)